MKTAIITTENHNVGDDFVREGIKYLIKKAFGKSDVVFKNIHKHTPITVRYGFSNVRSKKLSQRLDPYIPKKITKDKILEADLVVQSGAPVYWCHRRGERHCCNNEWYEPLIKDRFIKNKKAKLINLAAGTCQAYHYNGENFCPSCNSYIKDFFELSDVTTLRDSLSKVLLSNQGLEAPVIPCSSIFAIDEHGLQDLGNDYIVINYMRGGAHYTFGQDIHFENWEKELKKFYFELKDKENIVFSCHNQNEVLEVRKIDPQAKIFYAKNDYLAYMQFYAKAKFGIMNRVHGAFLMASYGKPSIVIGNDTRARMAEEIGLEHYFVNDVDCELLRDRCEFLNSGANCFKERFVDIKKTALEKYMQELSRLY